MPYQEEAEKVAINSARVEATVSFQRMGLVFLLAWEKRQNADDKSIGRLLSRISSRRDEQKLG